MAGHGDLEGNTDGALSYDDGNQRLRDAQHRFNNTLQLIRTLIAMQRRLHPAAAEPLTALELRITAIALGERHIQQSDGTGVPLGACLDALTTAVLQHQVAARVTREDDVRLRQPQIVPVGLLVCEILTQIAGTVRDATDDGRPPVPIDVLLRRPEPTRAVLEIGTRQADAAELTDDGEHGRLIELLARQIRASIEVLRDPGDGMSVRVSFPLQ
ncbi:MAG TPA: histidine kinase dimerization/phosphoacceptor domain -containing protein [Alphaproteobacteria bacterium]